MAANLNPLNKLASSILNSFLSNYFESFQNKVVNFSLGGDIELTELEVKKDVLDGLRLPIQIKFGSLGRLKCSVPWAELTRKPTVVNLNQLFLIIEPSTVTKYDPKEEEERQQKIKQQKLKVFKMQQLAKPEEDTGKKVSKNFGQRMATNILANLQVEINNIHIRFEDGKAPIPFAAGLTIENLRVQTTDDKWKVTKVKPSGVSYKLTSINNMAVYFNIGEKPLRYNSLAEAYKLMEALIPTDLNAVKHDYIIKMESLRVKATIDQDATAADDKPKIYATVVSDRIPIDLSKGQYDAALFLTKKMTSHTTLTKYLQHRPSDKTVKEAPRAWWQFAMTCVMKDNEMKRNQWRWSTIKQRRDDRLKYINLYRKKKLKKNFNLDRKAELKKLEKKLTFEDIVYFRSMAMVKIKQYKKLKKDSLPKTAKNQLAALLESKKEKKERRLKLRQQLMTVQLTEEEQQEIYKSLELNADDDGATHPSWVQFKFDVTLPYLSISVKDDDKSDLLRFFIEDFRAKMELRQAWHTFKFELYGLTLVSLLPSAGHCPDVVVPQSRDQKTPLLKAQIELNPLGGPDLAVDCSAQPFAITYNKDFTERLMKFFLGPITEEIRAKLASLTPSQINYMLENTKTVALKLNLKAPAILVPESFEDPKARVIVLDLGTLKVETVLAKKLIQKDKSQDDSDVQSSAEQSKSEDALKGSKRKKRSASESTRSLTKPVTPREEIKKELYDELHIFLSDIQVYLSSLNTKKKSERMSLLDPFTINLDLFLSKLPDVESISQIKFKGNIPRLNFNISPARLEQVYRIVNSLMSQFGSSAAPTEPVAAIKPQLIDEQTFTRDVMIATVKSNKKVSAKIVEGEFTLDEVIVAIATDTEQLARMEVRKLSLNMDVQSWQVSMAAKLHSIVIEDLCQKPPIHMATSKVIDDDSVAPSNSSDLIQFSFLSIPKEAPFYANVDQELSISFNRMAFTFNPPTVLKLFDLVMKVLPSPEAKGGPVVQEVTEEEPEKEPTEQNAQGTQLLRVKKLDPTAPAKKVGKTILTRVQIKMNAVKLTLVQDTPLAEFILENSAVELVMHENATSVKGNLGTFSIINPRGDKHYRRIIDIKSDRLMDFGVEIVPSTKYDNCTETSIKIKMHSLRLLYIHKFLLDLIGFMLTFNFHLSHFRKLDKQTVKPVDCTQLDIRIKNVLLVAPTFEPNAKDVMIAEVGGMSISNYIEEVEEGLLWLMMKIAIQGLNARNGYMRKGDWRQQNFTKASASPSTSPDAVTDPYIMDELNVDLHMSQPLVPEMRKPSQPELKMKISLTPIELKVSHTQLRNIFTMVTYNFMCEMPQTFVHQVKEIELQKLQKRAKIKESNRIVETMIDLDVERFSLGVWQGLTPIMSIEGNKFDAHIELYEDHGKLIDLQLFELVMEDIRADSDTHEKFRKLVKPKKQDQNGGQFSMKLIKMPDTHQDMVLNCKSLDVFIVPGLVLKLVELMLPIAPVIEKLVEHKRANKKLLRLDDRRDRMLAELRDKNSIGLDLTFVLTEPQFILVEDATRPDCRVIIFSADFEGRFFQRFHHQKLNSFAKNFQIKRTQMPDPSKPEQRIDSVQMLQPVDLVIALNASNTELLLYLDLKAPGPLELTFSYRDFKLFYTIMTKTMEQVKNMLTSPVMKQDTMIELPTEKNQIRVFQLTETPPASQEGAMPRTPSGSRKKKMQEKIDINPLKMIIKLVDDLRPNEAQSLFSIKVNMQHLLLTNWSSKLVMQLKALIAADYFNYGIQEWEPIIEPWGFRVEVEEKNANITSNEIFNINVTKALMNQLQSTFFKWKDDFLNVPAEKIRRRRFISASQTSKPIRPLSRTGSGAEKGTIGDTIMMVNQIQYRLSNTSQTDIELKFLPKESKAKNLDLSPIVLVANGEACTLPYDLLKIGRCAIRPKGLLQYSWSEKDVNLLELKHGSNMLNLQFSVEQTSQVQTLTYSLSINPYDEFVPNTLVYMITIAPAMRVENQLLCQLDYQISERLNMRDSSIVNKGTIKQEENVALTNFPLERPLSISIKIPDCDKWSNFQDITSKNNIGKTFSVVVTGTEGTWMFNVETSMDQFGTVNVVVYSPYWIVNKSGLPLLYYRGKEPKSLAPGQPAWKVDKKYDRTLVSSEPRDMVFDELLKEEPLMFSFATQSQSNLYVRIAKKYNSTPLNLKAQNTKGFCFLRADKEHKDENRLFELAVSIEPAPRQFWRAKIITFLPRYVFVNKTDSTLELQQLGITTTFTLNPGESYPFHWFNGNLKDLHLRVKFDSPDCQWSGGFSVSEQTNLSILMKSQKEPNSAAYTVRLQTRLLDGAINVVDFYGSHDHPFYQIENTLDVPVFVQQKGAQLQLKVLPNSVINWGLAEPSMPATAQFTVLDDPITHLFDLDQVKTEYRLIDYTDSKKEARKARVWVDLKGATRILKINDSTTQIVIGQVNSDNTEFTTLALKLPRVGISVVSFKPEELIYIALDKIDLHFVKYNDKQSIELNIEDFQIDNQSAFLLSPVLLWSNAPEPKKFLQFSLVFSQSASIIHVEHFSMLMRELNLALDEQILLKLLYFTDITMESLQRGAIFAFDEEKSEDGDNIISKIAKMPVQTNWVFSSFMFINPMKVNVTFLGYRPDDSVRSAFTNVLLGIPKELIINVDNAPIRLNGVELQNQLFTKQVLANTLLLHFKNQALQEIYKVVGSADMFGNPVGFVQSLGTGVMDFFYEPAKGITISPKEFVSGVGKGSFSLVKNTISGAFNTASKITGSIGSGVASLSADNDYQIQRLEDIQQNKPKHVFEGIGRGLLSFGRGIFDGISGLVTQPIKGSQQEGAAGFFKGMGRGFAGVVVKPVVGALDLASKTTEGIKNTTDLFQPSVVRKRLPRHFKTGKLEVFHTEDAEAQNELHTLARGQFKFERFVFRVKPLSDNTTLLVSNESIIVKSADEQVVLSIKFKDLSAITVQEDTLVLPMRGELQAMNTIKCASKKQAEQISNKLGGIWLMVHREQQIAAWM